MHWRAAVRACRPECAGSFGVCRMLSGSFRSHRLLHLLPCCCTVMHKLPCPRVILSQCVLVQVLHLHEALQQQAAALEAAEADAAQRDGQISELRAAAVAAAQDAAAARAEADTQIRTAAEAARHHATEHAAAAEQQKQEAEVEMEALRRQLRDAGAALWDSHGGLLAAAETVAAALSAEMPETDSDSDPYAALPQLPANMQSVLHSLQASLPAPCRETLYVCAGSLDRLSDGQACSHNPIRNLEPPASGL